MSVYRVNKTRDFTVMGNTHLRDKNLSLKAVGLLSKMLSFNDGWQFSTRGLAALCKEGPDAILSALKELEENGYLVRHRGRDDKGRMVSTEFDIYEMPQAGLPHRDNPHRENPDVENPDVENPHRENPAQRNTIQVITQERNTLSKNYQSINLDVMDRMDERSEYEEIIKENLDYNILCQDPKFDKDRFREIMDIMLDAVCSTAPTIRINGENGVYGTTRTHFSGQLQEIAFAQEVVTGPAEIWATIEGETPRAYRIQIERVSDADPRRNLVIRVTDPSLLSATGGIVQGMSGSPILQNGRLVGAVTHVLVNDPTRGYGIFAQTMLEQAKNAVQNGAEAQTAE